jgi:O-methyltransferase
MDLYIDLLKKSVLDFIYDVSLGKYDGSNWPSRAQTMVGLKRLNNLEFCVRDVIKNNVQGHFIETGVWRGGSCIFVRGIFKSYNSDKIVYVADSFEGLPKPDGKYEADIGDTLHTFNELIVSLDEVKSNFAKYDLLDDGVVFLKGWFKDTLPVISKDVKFSVIRLDGDMYESTMDALVNLYHRLSPGGYCIIDDYGCIQACKKAVDDFRDQNRISDKIIQVDWTGVYWKKT